MVVLEYRTCSIAADRNSLGRTCVSVVSSSIVAYILQNQSTVLVSQHLDWWKVSTQPENGSSCLFTPSKLDTRIRYHMVRTSS